MTDTATLTARNLTALLHHQGSLATDYRIDATTERVPCVRRRPSPVIVPGAHWWMEKAVFDARPIYFADRQLIYFCAQQRYRTDSAIVVGLADCNSATEVQPYPHPVLFPDVERRGIDIPSFTVSEERIVAVYMDNYGPRRVNSGMDCGMVVAVSSDGISFKKSIVTAPFRQLRAKRKFRQIGLPWVLKDLGRLFVYFRAKDAGGSCIIRATLEIDALQLSDFQLWRCEENLVNIAIGKKHSHYWLFFGFTYAGGFYVKASRDGVNFSDQTLMAVDPEDDGWGWDWSKIAVSPFNSFETRTAVCYGATAGGKMAIGMAEIDTDKLLQKFEE